MSLLKWNNRSLLPSVNSFFDDFFEDDDNLAKSISRGTSTPAVNVVEEDSNFVLEIAAPGKQKDDFAIALDGHVLNVSSEVEEEHESESKNYMRKEYSYNSFKRSFTLPDNVKEDDIEANYENGILKVILPKKEPKQHSPKRISIS